MIRVSFKPLMSNNEEIVCIPIDTSGNLPMELSWIKVKYPKFYLKYRQVNPTEIGMGIIDMTKSTDAVIENIVAGIVINKNKNDDTYVDYDRIQELFNYIAKKNQSVAIPYGFGCNLKNKGDWNRIYKMIMNTFYNHEKGVIIYNQIKK